VHFSRTSHPLTHFPGPYRHWHNNTPISSPWSGLPNQPTRTGRPGRTQGWHIVLRSTGKNSWFRVCEYVFTPLSAKILSTNCFTCPQIVTVVLFPGPGLVCIPLYTTLVYHTFFARNPMVVFGCIQWKAHSRSKQLVSSPHNVTSQTLSFTSGYEAILSWIIP